MVRPTTQKRGNMSEQQRPKTVVIQEVLRPAPCAGRRLSEGEDLSETNRLLAQLRAAAPSAKKGGSTNNGGSPPKK
jgi:hypothetical protein